MTRAASGLKVAPQTTTGTMTHDFQHDIDAVGRLAAVPTILDVVCRVTGMGFAAVARVTEHRWITCAVKDDIAFGLVPGSELEVRTTICDEIRDSREGVVIDHVAEDPSFCQHHTPLQYGFQSYISMPIIRSDGSFFGTLCSIDPAPAKLNNPETIGMFKLFAQLIAAQLDADEKLVTANASLASTLQEGDLREQFIAVLGHDLRNPVAAVGAGAKMLLREPQTDKARHIITLMQNSILRMSGLIDNVLDFARGRLGGGMTLDLGTGQLDDVLRHVVNELRAVNPDREIITSFDVADDVHADQHRIAQLFSNLLGNALTHGSAEHPVRAEARTEFGNFILSVSNGGTPIDEAALAGMFQPFQRSADRHRGHQQGLGLGLYIASRIAEAHGGKLTVSSNPSLTTFTFTMPVHAQNAAAGHDQAAAE